MAAGVANVTTIIKVEGRDAASRSINKAKGSLDRMGRSLTKVQTKAAAAAGSLRAMASGDAIGAVQGLTSAMGGAGGLAAVAAASTVGVVALGAAVGVAAVKFTEWSVQINRMKAGLDAALGPNGLEKAIAISNALGGVSAESIGKVAARLKLAGVNAEFTAEQLTELTKRATVAGKTGDEALEAFASAIEKGNTRALKGVGTFINFTRVQKEYADAIGKSTTELTAYDTQMAVVAALQKDLNRQVGKTTEAHDRQDKALSRLTNAWTLFTSKLSDALGGPMVGIVEKLAEMAEKGLRFGKTLTLLAKVSLGVFIAQIKVAKEVLGGFWQIAGKLQARDFTGALEEAGGALVKMKDVFAKDAWGDMKALWAALGEGVPALGGVEDGTLRVGSALDALLAKVPQLSTVGGAVGSAIGGGLAALNKAEKDNTKKGGGKKAAKAPDFGDKFSGLLGMGKQNQIDLDKQLNDQEAAAAQSKLDWAERLRMVETEEIARGFDRLDMLAKEKAARGALNSTMFSSAKAAAVGAAGAIQSERARAGVMAIVAAADAALAYSTGNIPGGITATFAALQYAKVALMSAPQVPSSSGSATSSTGSAATPSAANGGTGTNVTVVLQGGVLVGTVQELGNFVQGAVSSLNGTGLARGTA